MSFSVLITKLAVFLAERFNGEVLNGDALQLYEGLPITTNKIPEKEQKGIPHHLFGCIGLKEQPWTVVRFASEARRTIEQIEARGKVPILVGGTNYYTQALLFRGSHIEQNVPSMPVSELQKRWPVLKSSNEEISKELRRLDPAMADRWHPNDTRKIRRSLEICLQTGRKASNIYAQQHDCPLGLVEASTTNGSQCKKVNNVVCSHHDPLIFWVYSETETLNNRLANRVDNMVRTGLLSEIQCMNAVYKSYLDSGVELDTGRGIWVAIGYKEFEEYLRSIQEHASEARIMESKKIGIEKTIIATRQYAKRQIRWIRLKLMSSLRDAQADDKLFLLDGSQLEDWSLAVEQKAAKVTKDYLAGLALPDPKHLSQVAFTVLSKEEAARSQPPPQARLCELCGVSTTTSIDWQQHSKSKRHKYMLQNQ